VGMISVFAPPSALSVAPGSARPTFFTFGPFWFCHLESRGFISPEFFFTFVLRVFPHLAPPGGDHQLMLEFFYQREGVGGLLFFGTSWSSCFLPVAPPPLANFCVPCAPHMSFAFIGCYLPWRHHACPRFFGLVRGLVIGGRIAAWWMCHRFFYGPWFR